MERDKAAAIGDEGLERIRQGFQAQLDIIYGTPGFDADGFTDFLGSELLTLDYEKARQARGKWVGLLGELQARPRYTVFVRAQLATMPRATRELFPDTKNVRNAWIRIYRDLTPDKFAFRERGFPVATGNDTVISHASVVEIDHPSIVFTHPGHTLSALPIEDGPGALFAVKGNLPSSHDPNAFERLEGEVNEWDVDFTSFSAESVDEIENKLMALGSEQHVFNNGLWAIMGEHRDFITWSLDESQRI